MQAIVLVGGEGTRLRPLTDDRAEAGADPGRPALPRLHDRVAGRPRGDEVVLACGFLPDVLREALGRGRARGGRGSRYVVEPEPRGTAGAIRFAADALGDGSTTASSPSTATSSPTST